MKKVILLMLISMPLFIFGQQLVQKVDRISQLKEQPTIVHPTTIKKPVGYAISGPLNKINLSNSDYQLLNNSPNPFFGRENREIQPGFTVPDYSKINDPNVQTEFGKIKNNSKAIANNYEGQTSGSYPPDCNGDVGPTYYFQTVNKTYTIYKKSDGSAVANGNLNTIFDSSLPGAGRNDGDPIVLWDEKANRWLYVEFSVPNAKANDYMLIAVSQTADPTGSWYSWSFDVDDTPDYMKFGIWQDGYYMATNTGGSGKDDVYVFERDVMIAGGASPQMIGFDNPNRPATFDGFHCIMPFDNDGDWAPSGTPGGFITIADKEQGNSADELRIYELDVDWTTPSSSTFSMTQQLPVNSFSGEFDAADWDNIPQPGTSQQLDGISTVLMYRAQYRNFSGTQKLVCTHTIAETGTEGAIRWYILENTGSGWSIDQQSTYNPGGADDVSRWLPSIAMNGNGQVAIGFSTSSPTNTVYPGIHIIGRSTCASDNTMDISEFSVVEGGTYQNSYNRWGDYANMSVDPSDDYTFWFTTEYMDASSHSIKHTKFVEFTLDESCAVPTIDNISPTSLYEDRGKQLTITGSDMTGSSFVIGGVTGTVSSNDGSTAVVVFPAGNYTDGTLVVTNGAGSNNSKSITINTRNTIPVVSGASATSDNHPTILSAVNGLHAWYGTTAFDAGDLAGTKTINVSAGTYTDEVELNSELNPTSANPLIIQNNSGDVVIVDATGNDYGFNLNTVDYVTLKGFNVHKANLANIYAKGNNVTIQYNKAYGSTKGSGIKIETGTPFTVKNNLSYDNYNYGIEINSSNNIIKNNSTDNNGHSLTGTQVITNTFTGSSAINDNSYTYGDITVSENVTITDVQVQNMNIDHTYDEDLDIYLLHPDATEVELSTDNGSSEDNYTDTNFDDAGSSSITSGSAPFTGTFKPEGNLSDFDGKASNGTWRLRIYDDANGDEGTLKSWKLKISYIADSQIGAGIYVGSVTGNTIENNIIVAKAGDDNYYALQSPDNSVSSDYNTYYTTNTSLFDYDGTQDNTGPMSSNDISSDPLFIGSGDYHIKSTNDSYHGGEWPPTTATSGTWTNDASDSPAIDTGNPADTYTNEPESGNRINQGAYGNTVQASKSGVSIVTINWTGNIDSDWQNTGNWDSGTIPTSAENVVITDVTNDPIIDDGTTTAVCNDITIDAGAILTIAINGQMTVSGSITNNAGNAGLTINSDDSGTGSLIHNSVGGVDATVKRKLSSTGRQWHMLASPIDAAPLSIFSSTANLYIYNESTDDFWTGVNYDSGSSNGWESPSVNMVVAKGYVYNYFAETLTFTGQLNDNSSTGSISVPYTDHGATAPNGNSYDDFDGWNFIGNPYTSAIDWDNAAINHAGANLLDAIYCYDDKTAHTYTSYVDGVGTNGGTQYIPAMQGFFVKGDNTETSGTLDIGAGALVHNSQAFWKEPKETPNNFIRLQVSSNSYNDETIVRLLDNATENMDNGMDAYKMFTWDTNVPQIYTNSNSSTLYSINSLETINEGSISVPLKVAQTDGNFSITISEFNFSNIKVYLKDNLNSETIQLGLNDILSFTTDASDTENRFELIFEKNTTNILQALNTYVNIFPNPNSGIFYLTVGDNTNNYKVSITNVAGQLIYENKFNDSYTKKLILNSKAKGIYFVKIMFSDKSVINKKIIIE